MARILFGLVLFAVALVQATIIPRINPFMVAPDFVLVLLFVWVSRRGMRESLAWLFLTGILIDVLAQDSFGTNAIALLPVAGLAALSNQRIFLANVLVPIVLVGIATIGHGVLLLALRGSFPAGLSIPIQAGVHMLIIPLFLLVRRAIGR